MSFFKNLDKKQVLSWALYDFANSSYALIIISFIFPIFYRDIIAGEKYGDFYWGLIISISILLGGLASPILGAIADEHKRKKSKFIFLVTSSSVGTALLYLTGSQTLLFDSVLFVLTNLFYEMAQSLYDSFLPQISTKETV
jgi:UMF1 family MFS transporter